MVPHAARERDELAGARLVLALELTALETIEIYSLAAREGDWQTDGLDVETVKGRSGNALGLVGRKQARVGADRKAPVLPLLASHERPDQRHAGVTLHAVGDDRVMR